MLQRRRRGGRACHKKLAAVVGRRRRGNGIGALCDNAIDKSEGIAQELDGTMDSEAGIGKQIGAAIPDAVFCDGGNAGGVVRERGARVMLDVCDEVGGLDLILVV
jgi:hypothetical protein